MKKANRSVKTNSTGLVKPQQTKAVKRIHPEATTAPLPPGLITQRWETQAHLSLVSRCNASAQDALAMIHTLFDNYWNMVHLLPKHDWTWRERDDLEKKVESVCEQLASRMSGLHQSATCDMMDAMKAEREGSLICEVPDGKGEFERVGFALGNGKSN